MSDPIASLPVQPQPRIDTPPAPPATGRIGCTPPAGPAPTTPAPAPDTSVIRTRPDVAHPSAPAEVDFPPLTGCTGFGGPRGPEHLPTVMPQPEPLPEIGPRPEHLPDIMPQPEPLPDTGCTGFGGPKAPGHGPDISQRLPDIAISEQPEPAPPPSVGCTGFQGPRVEP